MAQDVNEGRAFRIRVVERNVREGKQDPRDLDAVKRYGSVTSPSISHELARQYARLVDAGKRSKRDIPNAA